MYYVYMHNLLLIVIINNNDLVRPILFRSFFLHVYRYLLFDYFCAYLETRDVFISILIIFFCIVL